MFDRLPSLNNFSPRREIKNEIEEDKIEFPKVKKHVQFLLNNEMPHCAYFPEEFKEYMKKYNELKDEENSV